MRCQREGKKMQANCEGESYLPSLGEKLMITWMMKSSPRTALLFSLSPRRATIHIRGGRIGQTMMVRRPLEPPKELTEWKV